MKSVFVDFLINFLFIYLYGYQIIAINAEVFTLGYLTGSQRRSGNLEYAKPGKQLSVE